VTILKNVTIRYAKLNPARPSKKVNKDGEWSVQAYTKDKDQKEEWRKAGINVKLGEDATGIIYTVNFKKKALKKDGEKNKPPSVVNAKLVAIDPTTIGNGSLVNLRLFEYDYTYEGKPGRAFQLQSVQVLRHIVFRPKPFEDFEEAEDTEVIEPEATEYDGEPPDETPDVKW
jgi:hypothetical protein